MNVHPLDAVLVGLFLNLRGECYCAHDAIAKLLVNDGLVSITIVLHDLKQAIDQRLLRWHLDTFPSVWKATQLRVKNGLLNPQVRRQLLDIFWGSASLSVEHSSNCDLTSTELLSDCLERRSLFSLGGEERCGGLWQLRMLRYLLVLFIALKLAKVWVGANYIKSGQIGVRHADGALSEAPKEERADDVSRDSCVLC